MASRKYVGTFVDNNLTKIAALDGSCALSFPMTIDGYTIDIEAPKWDSRWGTGSSISLCRVTHLIVTVTTPSGLDIVSKKYSGSWIELSDVPRRIITFLAKMDLGIPDNIGASFTSMHKALQRAKAIHVEPDSDKLNDTIGNMTTDITSTINKLKLMMRVSPDEIRAVVAGKNDPILSAIFDQYIDVDNTIECVSKKSVEGVV